MATISDQMHSDGMAWVHLSIYPLISAIVLTQIGDEADSCVKKYAALVGAELFSFLAIPIGIIDTVFWSAIFLLTKTIHVFIPRSFEMATSICSWFCTHAFGALEITAIATNTTVFNFFKSHNEIVKLNDTVDKCFRDGIENWAPIVDFQLFS